FGIVLYEMIAGCSPFKGVSPRQIIDSILKTDPLPISDLHPEVPEIFEWIVIKALVKDREERYQSAKEMLNDLRRLHHRLGVENELERSRINTNSSSGTTEKNRLRSNAQSTQALEVLTGWIKSPYSSGIFAHWQSGQTPLRRNKPFLVTFSSLVLVIVGFGGYLLLRPRSPITIPFESIPVSRFTTNGKTDRAAISAPGQYIGPVFSEAGAHS